MDESTAITSTGSMRRQSVSWIGAGVCALLLNAVLFGLMPGLVNRTPEKPAFTEQVPMVNILRLKRPELTARRKEPPRVQPEKKPQKTLRPEKAISRPRTKAKRLNLPFEINPALPAGPATVPVLPLETVSVGAPRFKSSYAVGEIDGGLTPLAKVAPLYPLRARRRGIEGWVTVRFVVNEQGRVDEIDITAAEPEKIFDQSVMQCVSSWRFTPGKVAGVPVKTRVETTIRFELK